MKEISMHILDIAMNSIKAKATLLKIDIQESKKNNLLKISINDNGVGMNEEMTKRAIDPFFTTRTTRKVGLGLSLLKDSCERCNGKLTIDSQLGRGTTVKCYFQKNNIDLAPMGNMGDTIMTIINCLDNCELIYTHEMDDGSFCLNTVETKKILDGLDIKDSGVLLWIKDYINENLAALYKN
ncbi:MAG: ATP-binding protein [Sedimentibacter sp.]